MNKLNVLHSYLKKAVEHRDLLKSRGQTSDALKGWHVITGIESKIDLYQRLNELQNIAFDLNNKMKIRASLDGDDDDDWLYEIVVSLSPYGIFEKNLDNLHKHTLTIVKSNIRNWDGGYTIHSTLDEEKIKDFIENLQAEKQMIIDDLGISYNLKSILLEQIEKLIYSLQNFSVFGEEYVKDAATSFYTEAFFNKDIQEYYKGSPNLKETVEGICASINIANFVTPIVGFFIESATKVIGQ